MLPVVAVVSGMSQVNAPASTIVKEEERDWQLRVQGARIHSQYGYRYVVTEAYQGAHVTTHLTHRLGASLLAGIVLIGGTTGALAAKGTKVHANRATATGLVSNLSATGFTLTRTTKATASTAAAVKTAQVTFDTAAKERATKGTTGVLANGEYALVVGQKTAAGIAAKRVVYSTTAKGLRHAIRGLARVRAGTVSAVTPAGITITTKAGKTFTFTVTTTTTYRVNKQPATTAPTFTTGEKVRVLFRRDRATKSLVALTIAVPVQK
jgi:hypothetical protein